MKSIFKTLGLAACLALASVNATTAQPIQSGDPYADCLQRCFEQYTANLAACKDACEVCDTYILFICVSWKLDQTCYTNCKQHAEEVYQACKAGCGAQNPE
jgi:hypothetical protein